MQRFAEIFAKRAVYIVITAALAIPVWVATRTHFSVPLQQSSLSTDATEVTPREAVDEASGATPRRTPMVASMAPVNQRPPVQTDALSLRFSNDSWVRVTSVDGRVMEEVVLAAGDLRKFLPGEVGEIVIGNAEAVEVRQQGQVLDLKPYQRANVARFTVSSDGSLQAVAQ